MAERKLSPAMQHVLDRMREGWTLTRGTSSLSTGAYLKHAPVNGKRGWARVRSNTVFALEARDLIVEHYGYPEATYTLAAAPEATP